MLLRLVSVFVFCALIGACGGGGGSSTNETPAGGGSGVVDPDPIDPDPVDPDPIDPDPVVTTVQISGTLTYDFVPHLSNGGLDYDNIRSETMKGVVVQLLNSGGGVVASTVSSNTGEYNFSVDSNTQFQVRVQARMLRAVSPSWQIDITDNTDGNSLYSLVGTLASSGSANSVRNLHASSGWTGSSYGQPRAAAPFAMLDSVFQLLDQLVDEGFNENLPATELRWSVNNIANSGSNASGNIGTSKYDPNANVMYILGHEDNDTDEYDRSVIQHEFVHYLEDQISRSNSIGGQHSGSDQLDMRVAFSEGLANGVTAVASGTGYYEDSALSQQRAGFRLFYEPITTNRGWFSSASVANIVLDISDDTSEAGDNLDLGLISVINALTNSNYTGSPALTSIYLFLDSLKSSVGAAVDAEIDAIAADHLIFGDGPWALGETNDAGISYILPVYHELSVGGPAVQVCTGGEDNNRFYNAVETRAFLRVNVTAFTDLYRINVSASSGTTGVRDPDIEFFSNGRRVRVFDSEDENVETATILLDQGAHVMEVYDYNNLDAGTAIACFDVTIEEA